MLSILSQYLYSMLINPCIQQDILDCTMMEQFNIAPEQWSMPIIIRPS